MAFITDVRALTRRVDEPPLPANCNFPPPKASDGIRPSEAAILLLGWGYFVASNWALLAALGESLL